MINTLPLRLTTLHLAQRFRTDGETFMLNLLANDHSIFQIAKSLIIYFPSTFVQTTQVV